MIPRREDFPSWRDWAQATLEQTELELSLTREEWEDLYGVRWPGDGYRETLRAQKIRFETDLGRGSDR